MSNGGHIFRQCNMCAAAALDLLSADDGTDRVSRTEPHPIGFATDGLHAVRQSVHNVTAIFNTGEMERVQHLDEL